MQSDGPGRGTEVVFDLPIESPDRTAGPPATSTTTAAVRRRILVIEDHSDAAASLETLLALEGHDVRIAANGPAGLALARTFDPDVVLCDLGLPTMDGFEVARAFRAEPALCGRRLIAVSGYAQPGDVARAYSAGFDGHLAKPVTWASLQEVLASIRSPD